ncbi:MAG: hypothetical protein Q8914_07380 [Bacteroidota bacterium]|nr:hypothetical protein [Bacteroidota bacterium]
MKKFVIRIVLFLVIASVIDVCVGYCFAFLQRGAKGGDTLKDNYICRQTKEDILIFGSSRAIHHYNPIIIQDSLHLSCYNCGQDGNGIILMFGRYKIISERYHPKIIIYDVCDGYDLLVGEDNHKYLAYLRPYYNECKSVDSIFWNIDYTEKYKMFSKMYQYNSKFIQLLGDYLHPMQDLGFNGFRPYKQTMNYEPKIKNDIRKTTYSYDSLKLTYFKEMIKMAKGKTILIFVASPAYKATDSRVFAPLKEICKQNNVSFLDYYCDPEISTNRMYFQDPSHLNGTGADAFTKKIIPQIRFILNSDAF